ncbi:unnamed protein product [Adineta ricciae]|uniref:Uncharacterized protein n=1 Tax=Adineta ricciae TaxID=249248 RepID=A0A815E2J0_ADIRI|nr:unnamed protein product [Adineta ricciae]
MFEASVLISDIVIRVLMTSSLSWSINTTLIYLHPTQKYQNMSAAQFIVQRVIDNPGRITLCVIDPLT